MKSKKLKKKRFPYVIDVWQRCKIPRTALPHDRLFLACATEATFNNEVKNQILRETPVVSSIEFVTGSFLPNRKDFEGISESYTHYAWGNYFLYEEFTKEKYAKLTTIKQSDFTHKFSYYPGFPRHYRSLLIEKLAQKKYLNSLVKYTWTGLPAPTTRGYSELVHAGFGDYELRFKFKHFDNQRVIYNESLEPDNGTDQRLNHSVLPVSIIKAAPFVITAESDLACDFLTEKTYRSLANGVIPLIISRYNHYTYLQNLGYRFPKVVTDFNSQIYIDDISPQDLNDCASKMIEFCEAILDVWSKDLINECIECGIHNQRRCAESIMDGVGLPNSNTVQLYYSQRINWARYYASFYLDKHNIKYDKPKLLDYNDKFNFNKSPSYFITDTIHHPDRRPS